MIKLLNNGTEPFGSNHNRRNVFLTLYGSNKRELLTIAKFYSLVQSVVKGWKSIEQSKAPRALSLSKLWPYSERLGLTTNAWQ
jgi:hypothetical protein